MAYDRNEVLARTDLGELADQLIGPHKGHGAGATWPCPEPGHGEQSGKTPPVSTFRTTYGDERWRCHSCGAGGTAIDLVMTTQGVRFPEAIELLARRAGVGAVDQAAPALRTAHIQRPEPVVPAEPSPEVERFVAGAEAHLWSDDGQAAQRWLGERGLGEEVLRANRVGADPGPADLDRPRGLPRGGPAVVLPVLGAEGQAIYLQSRYLEPNGHKYDNPSAALAGPLPRVAEVRLPRPAEDPGLVVVSEGIPDALVAAQAGHRAAAVLGAGVPDERAAAALVERFPTEHLVVAFDADGPGQAGAERLGELLGELGAGSRVTRLEVPAAAGDLNGWQQLAGPDFGDQLDRALARTTETERTMATDTTRAVRQPGGAQPVAERGVVDDLLPPASSVTTADTSALETTSAHAAQGDLAVRLGLVADQAPAGDYVGLTRGATSSVDVVDLGRDGQPMTDRAGAATPPGPGQSDSDLVERLETIYYHHVLLDDPKLAAANVGRVEQAVGNWANPTLPHPTAGLAPAPEMATLDERLEQVAYRHVLVDEPELAERNLVTLRSSVGEWSAEVAGTDLAPPALDIAPDPARAALQQWVIDNGLAPPLAVDDGLAIDGGLAVDF